MPRNSSGVYTLPASNPVAANTIIATSWANPTMSDIGTELTNSLDRNGRGGMLAPFRISDGLVNTPGLAFTNEPATGIWRPGTGAMGVTVQGQNVATFYVKRFDLADGSVVTGNFSSATLTDRVFLQTNVLNGSSFVTVAPNGSGITGAYVVVNTSDVGNTAGARFLSTVDKVRIELAAVGAGVLLPFEIFMSGGGGTAVWVDPTTCFVGIGTAVVSATHRLLVSGSIGATALAVGGALTGASITVTGAAAAGTVTATTTISATTALSAGTTVTAGTTVSDAKGEVRLIPQNLQAGSYILAATDHGKHVAAGAGVTLNTGVFTKGQAVTIYNNSAVAETITAGVGVTLRLAGGALVGNRTLAQRGLCTILCVVDSTEFVISGSGLT